MIRPSGSWSIGRCGATNCAIRACAPTLRTRKGIGATTARSTGWMPPNALRKDCSSGAFSI